MGTELAKTIQEKPREKVPLPIGLAVFLCVVIALVFAAFQIRDWLQDEQQLPIQKIVFTGELQMVDTTALENKIRQENAGSFFAVDVNRVHTLVEQEPWVYNASIRKRWPSVLYVHIVEENAVAIWNSDLVLNKYGDVFQGLAEVKKTGVKLPLLFGPNGSEKTALVGYNHMRILLEGSGQVINELFLSERFAWTLSLANEITLNLGRQEYIDRLQRFVDVYPVISEQNKAIEYIDLRYDTGLSVGWADRSEQSNESSSATQ